VLEPCHAPGKLADLIPAVTLRAFALLHTVLSAPKSLGVAIRLMSVQHGIQNGFHAVIPPDDAAVYRNRHAGRIGLQKFRARVANEMTAAENMRSRIPAIVSDRIRPDVTVLIDEHITDRLNHSFHATSVRSAHCGA